MHKFKIEKIKLLLLQIPFLHGLGKIGDIQALFSAEVI
jgi:hypothetical protein